MNVYFKKLNEKAHAPLFASADAAGVDLYSIAAAEIAPGGTVKVGTGLSMEIPIGCFGALFARSGLATKQGLRPANCVGVIDSDYRGEIIVALHNDSNELQEIEEGERIAQLVILPLPTISYIEATELTDTERGAGGFGHSGKN